MRFKRAMAGAWMAALLVSAVAMAAPGVAPIVLLRPAASPAEAVDAVADALKAGDPDRAMRLAALALDRNDLEPRERAHILLNRGLAQQQLGGREQALGDFESALRIRSLPPVDRARALFDRGVVFDELGRTDQAIAGYTAALRLVPAMPAALNNRANAYRRLGRLAEARRDYEASLRTGNPAPQFSNYGLGQIAEAQGNPLAAQDYYRTALAADPDYAIAKQRLVALGMAQAAFVLHPPVPRPGAPLPRARHAAVTRASFEPAGSIPELRPAILGAFATERHARVQLGAYRSESDAAEGWNKLAAQADGLLGGLTPQIVSVDLPGRGRFYRLRAGLLDRDGAGALCRRLAARDLACLPVRD